MTKTILLSFTLFSAAMSAFAGNIVLDPSFESAFPNTYVGAVGDGWVVTQGEILVTSIHNSQAAHTGTQAVYMTLTDTTSILTQTLTTIAGQSYTVSFWAADSFPNPLSLTFDGVTLFNGTAPTNFNTSPSDYVQFSFTGTASTTSTILAITDTYDAGEGTEIDDVSVTANAGSGVPEPSTWLLAGSALAALILRRSLLHVINHVNLHRILLWRQL
jgi:hypothetical protein